MGSQLLKESTPDCVRNLSRTDLYQQVEKSISLACPFKREGIKKIWRHGRYIGVTTRVSSADFAIYVFHLSHTWYLNAFKIYLQFEELHIQLCGAVCSGESMLPVSLELKLFKRGVDTPCIIYNAESMLPHNYGVKCQMTLLIVVFSVKSRKPPGKMQYHGKMRPYFIENLEKKVT
jgi:hypothetical protein